ncbi:MULTISPECIES: aminopeptidase [Cytobacillus]|uniref:Aminopeptidase n=1 Tax=Cytobacillus kochii TaxID=859143 RepID=A0A248TEC5_9BACI|nr:aminopeptidase [Cytobacillus kochii]ASV66516.1 aminopeptidase [Cytobacillus kochii]MCM3324067.1 aminopeptidase [Cytobacillus kochii]MCM3346529.1 aminopeptidase [Cytobacillus kochii]MDM5206663.1 aminopeptidase [Cytobacillus kochii]MDQ0188088.1 aminopeptidase [Cytobacillus kochii]
MSTFEEKLDKYAELAVRVGVNIQKGQSLVINTSIDSAQLVRKIVKNAYEAGADQVIVNWNDDIVSRTKYELAPIDSFKEYPKWRARETEELAENGAAFIAIVSSSPDLLKGIDPEKISTFQKASGQALAKYRKAVQTDKVSWTVISAPSQAWANMVFPDAKEEERVNLLWDAIFKATRTDLDDPIQAWKDHDQTLHEKVEYLNEKRYKKLHYTAPGTDLTIELPEKHLWVGAGSVNENGHEFMANMPTEEVFTVPHKYGVNGTVASTKPLSYGGNIIDRFSITFKDGRIVDYKAEEGEAILKQLVETDEGSHYLGEVALVPFQSPISQSNLLFYNTLFDENASNHLAIGSAYAFCVEGGKKMNSEELETNGLNESITHVDFMVGSSEMDIDGILEDGTTEPVFRKGDWAF